MAKSENQKKKILYILDILSRESDEKHPIKTKDLIEKLKSKGVEAERKSIYTDIDTLIEFGADIKKLSSREGGGCYLASGKFELAELKLLVDVVQSSKFITEKKSRELIHKLENMTSLYNAGALQRDVLVSGRVKTENESIYKNIDSIHNAIRENHEISFEYMDWNIKKELVRRDDKIRVVSPWNLIYVDENYYLAAYDDVSGMIRHYRVDKMGNVKVLSENRKGIDVMKSIDVTEYTKKTFGMFGGEEETVSLVFPNRLTGVVVDRFGKEVTLRSISEESVKARVKVKLSGQFYGWLSGIGKDIKVESPEYVKNGYREYLSDILKDFD
ncbi:MAG: WYL domain-containing protein [Acetatifactor sp.]|nr:WYL domain-containing protein [Acetatifactor sp.]